MRRAKEETVSEGSLGSDWSAALSGAGKALVGWRGAHPWATFEEIEAARDRYMQPVLAKMTGALAEASPAAEVAGMRCPTCRGVLWSGGKRGREVLGEGGQRIQIERTYARCQACGWAGFPPR